MGPRTVIPLRPPLCRVAPLNVVASPTTTRYVRVHACASSRTHPRRPGPLASPLGADSQLWCEVCDFAGELLLRVHDPVTDETTIAEVCKSIESAVGGADALRDQFVAAGWEVVDVDLDEPD